MHTYQKRLYCLFIIFSFTLLQISCVPEGYTRRRRKPLSQRVPEERKRLYGTKTGLPAYDKNGKLLRPDQITTRSPEQLKALEAEQLRVGKEIADEMDRQKAKIREEFLIYNKTRDPSKLPDGFREQHFTSGHIIDPSPEVIRIQKEHAEREKERKEMILGQLRYYNFPLVLWDMIQDLDGDESRRLREYLDTTEYLKHFGARSSLEILRTAPWESILRRGRKGFAKVYEHLLRKSSEAPPKELIKATGIYEHLLKDPSEDPTNGLTKTTGKEPKKTHKVYRRSAETFFESPANELPMAVESLRSELGMIARGPANELPMAVESLRSELGMIARGPTNELTKTTGNHLLIYSPLLGGAVILIFLFLVVKWVITLLNSVEKPKSLNGVEVIVAADKRVKNKKVKHTTTRA